MKFTLTEAREYKKAGKIEHWLHAYFHSEGDNIPLSDGLKIQKRYYSGPHDIALPLLTRCCGPEENMKYRVSEESFELAVNHISEKLSSGWDMPPLFIGFENGTLEVNDGNHRLEALLRSAYTSYPVIFWCSEQKRGHELEEWLKHQNVDHLTNVTKTPML